MQPEARVIAIRAEADLDLICPPEKLQPRNRPINPDTARSPQEALTLLNALSIWDGRIRWAAVQQRGKTLMATTQDGEQVRFEVDKLLRFAHAQARILESLAIVIRTPRRGAIAETWATVAELFMKAAQADKEDCGAPEDSLRLDLARCWRAAGKPELRNEDELREHLQWLDLAYERNPHSERAPWAVIVYAESALVHLPTFRTWASTPAGCARFFTLPELREAMSLLGFRSRRFDVESEGRRIQVTAWTGPKILLEEQE
ncbi:MAG TPA: hypothetical protein PLP04_15675 [Bryobacteraceae bacterium]|nr:hypothetical protein [Bryobacteraceae bacterium]